MTQTHIRGLALAATLALASSAANANVLNFDDLVLVDFDDIPVAYGDRSNDTPNVAIDYSTRDTGGTETFDNLDFWNNDYGDLSKVAYAVSNGQFAEITFTPDAGYEVVLISFDLAGWFRTDRQSEVRVIDGTSMLNFDGIVEGDGVGPGHSSFAPNLASTGPLTIRWGTDWNVGIDNIAFRQRLVDTRVPAPAPLALLGLGALALLARRRAA